MRIIIISLLSFVLFSCAPSSNTPTKVNLEGYELIELGNGVTQAQKTMEGYTSEVGFVSNGMMNGTWLTYYPDGKIKSMTTFSNNTKTGPHVEFNKRSQIELLANYNNGQLNGSYGEYKNGRPLKESNYSNGKLDGEMKSYFESGRNIGKIQELVEFKNGVQHGKMEYYNEEGEVILSYTYKNGNKVE